MADKEMWGVFAGTDEEPVAIFKTRQLAEMWNGSWVTANSLLNRHTIRPCRLRLLAPLHPAEPCIIHEDPD